MRWAGPGGAGDVGYAHAVEGRPRARKRLDPIVALIAGWRALLLLPVLVYLVCPPPWERRPGPSYPFFETKNTSAFVLCFVVFCSLV
jgi:hypothetical protein